MKKLLKHPIIIAIFTVLSIAFVLSLKKNVNKVEKSKVELEQLEVELNLLRQEVNNGELALKEASHSFSKESILRDELLMKKEGEVVLQLPAISESQEKIILDPTPKPAEEWGKLLF